MQLIGREGFCFLLKLRIGSEMTEVWDGRWNAVPVLCERVLTRGCVHAGRKWRVARAEDKLCSAFETASGVLHLVEKQFILVVILCVVFIVHLNVCE